MTLSANEKETLQSFCQDVLARYSKQVISIQLFGSRARGDATPQSDVDLLILTHQDDWHLTDAIGDLAFDYLLETGLYISCKVISQKKFEWMQQINSPFAQAVTAEAIPYAT